MYEVLLVIIIKNTFQSGTIRTRFELLDRYPVSKKKRLDLDSRSEKWQQHEFDIYKAW